MRWPTKGEPRSRRTGGAAALIVVAIAAGMPPAAGPVTAVAADRERDPSAEELWRDYPLESGTQPQTTAPAAGRAGRVAPTPAARRDGGGVSGGGGAPPAALVVLVVAAAATAAGALVVLRRRRDRVEPSRDEPRRATAPAVATAGVGLPATAAAMWRSSQREDKGAGRATGRGDPGGGEHARPGDAGTDPAGAASEERGGPPPASAGGGDEARPSGASLGERFRRGAEDRPAPSGTPAEQRASRAPVAEAARTRAPAAAPPDVERAWVAEVEWHHEEDGSYFRAVARSEGDEGE